MAEGLKLFEFSNVISCLNMVFNSKFSNRNINNLHGFFIARAKLNHPKNQKTTSI